MQMHGVFFRLQAGLQILKIRMLPQGATIARFPGREKPGSLSLRNFSIPTLLLDKADFG